MKTGKDLTLIGFIYEMRFTCIKQIDTERRVDDGHDCRENGVAHEWVGDLEIFSRWNGKGVKRPFHTDAFWPEHIDGLDLNDIFFLCVNSKIFGVAFKTDAARKLAIDHRASKLLAAFAFESLTNTVQRWHLRPFDFRIDYREKGLLEAGLISHHCLDPEHGRNGQVIEDFPIH